MSLAAAVELKCWELSRPSLLRITADESKAWKMIKMLGWPGLSAFTRAQHGSLVFQRLPSESNSDKWTSLKVEFMRSLRNNGFGNNLSSRLTGAMAELTNNVWDHSERTNTGLLGFQVTNRRFTIAIADLGIGVLQSLRQNPCHRSVTTNSAAIEKALVPGVSRFEDLSRGTGFIDFLSVATDLHGVARLRTGDVALTLDRRREGEEARNREYLADLAGFQIYLHGSLS